MSASPGYALPESYDAWQLFGAGFENLHEGHLKLREPGPKELLLRVDAVGLCLSDIKILRQGSKHPRLRGRDLSTEPTILGHECAVTVMKVGEAYADRFAPGERYIVQADIYYKGLGYAFGYLIPGGLGHYTYIDERAIEGDEGCYLLPVRPETGYSQSALTEPWACVEMSYDLHDRLEPLKDGRMLIVDGPGAAEVLTAFPKATRIARDAELPEGSFDDIVLPGPTPALTAACAGTLANNGVLFLLGAPEAKGAASLDIGRNHYEGIRFYGGGNTLAEVGLANRRIDLQPGGAALFIGGGGPMGQMHVQRAIETPGGPATVVATGLTRSRMDALVKRFGSLAERKGVQLHTISRDGFDSDEAMNTAIAELAPEGYTDLCVIAPDTALVTQALGWAADGALVNVFAGVPTGSMGDVPVEALCRGIKIIGSSGSRIRDMETVLRKIEGGVLDTNRSVAAIGGLPTAKEGLEGMRDARFPGKTIIYPHVPNLPLTAVDEIPAEMPQLAPFLSPDGEWTTEAEAALLAPYLDGAKA